MATSLPQRVPENAPGDFYVERGVCLGCCLPYEEAPELLNDPDDPNVPFRECYFRRQPQNDVEVEHALRAIRVSCVDALHYGGSDPKILARLEELSGPNARAAWACAPGEVPQRDVADGPPKKLIPEYAATPRRKLDVEGWLLRSVPLLLVSVLLIALWLGYRAWQELFSIRAP